MGRLYVQILDMSLQTSVVIPVVMLVRLLLKRAPKIFSYILWFVVLLRLLCPISIEAPISIVPDMESVSESYSLQDYPISPVSAGIAAYQAVGDAFNGGLGVQHIYTDEIQENGNQKIVTASWSEVWILFGQYVWLVGIGVMLICCGVSYCKLRKKLIGAMLLRDNIYLADHIDCPFVLGWIKPKIYLPSALSAQEQRYIIVHEQQHIRRFDHIVKLIAYLSLTLHWFNPLVWLSYILFCKDMEMSCDEAVVRIMGEDIRVDYLASLLNLATGRSIISVTPLAFGEGDTKGRIKNLLKWKKPMNWVIIASVMACITVAACLLTNPLGSAYGRVEKITNQIGYSIVSQESKVITLGLSTVELPDSIYSEEGCEFEDGKIIVYNDDVNQIYLKGARYSNEGTDNLYFYFAFSYDLPKDRGQLIYPLEINKDDYSFSSSVADGILRSGEYSIDNAVKFRGQDGDDRIWFYISADALKQIEGAFEFDIRINQITYLRDGAQSLPETEKRGGVKITDVSIGEEESELQLEVSLLKTDLSQPGQILADKISADWKSFDGLNQFAQYSSSRLPGLVYIETDTWHDCEAAIGVKVSNPLEQIDWIKKTGYIGMESVNTAMPATHIRASAYATRFTNRKLSQINIQSGYCTNNIRITLTATVCGEDTSFTTGSVTRGCATYKRTDAVTASGFPVIVVKTDRENNLGYYNDNWCDRDAYWVEGNVFYRLHLVGDKDDSAVMEDVLQKLLSEM